MSQEENYILIESYIQGDMEASERKAFEERLNTEPELAEQYQVYEETWKSLKSSIQREAHESELKNSLQLASQAYFAKAGDTPVLKPKRPWYLAVAAVVALLVAAVYVFNMGSPQYSDYAQYDALSLSLRSDDPDAVLRKKAETAFNAGDYTASANYLKQISDKNDSVKALFYLALSYIETGDYQLANTLLTELQNGTSVYKHRATWFRALCYLKQNKMDECKQLLEQIPVEAQDYQQAQDLLEAM